MMDKNGQLLKRLDLELYRAVVSMSECNDRAGMTFSHTSQLTAMLGGAHTLVQATAEATVFPAYQRLHAVVRETTELLLGIERAPHQLRPQGGDNILGQREYFEDLQERLHSNLQEQVRIIGNLPLVKQDIIPWRFGSSPDPKIDKDAPIAVKAGLMTQVRVPKHGPGRRALYGMEPGLYPIPGAGFALDLFKNIFPDTYPDSFEKKITARVRENGDEEKPDHSVYYSFLPESYRAYDCSSLWIKGVKQPLESHNKDSVTYTISGILTLSDGNLLTKMWRMRISPKEDISFYDISPGFQNINSQYIVRDVAQKKVLDELNSELNLLPNPYMREQHPTLLADEDSMIDMSTQVVFPYEATVCYGYTSTWPAYFTHIAAKHVCDLLGITASDPFEYNAFVRNPLKIKESLASLKDTLERLPGIANYGWSNNIAEYQIDTESTEHPSKRKARLFTLKKFDDQEVNIQITYWPEANEYQIKALNDDTHITPRSVYWLIKHVVDTRNKAISK